MSAEQQDFYNSHIGMPLEEFVIKNKGLAYSFANKYRKRAEITMDDLEDYQQICLLALVKSYHRYEPIVSKVTGKVAKPSTFAALVIKSDLTTYLRDKGYSVRYPREFQQVWVLMRKNGLEDERNPKLISKKIGVDIKWVKEAVKYFDAEQPLSFQAPQTEGKGYSDDNEGSLEDNIGRLSDFSIVIVKDFMDTLSYTERTVLELTLKDKKQEEIMEVTGHKANSSISRIMKRIRVKIHEYYAYARIGEIAQ